MRVYLSKDQDRGANSRESKKKKEKISGLGKMAWSSSFSKKVVEEQPSCLVVCVFAVPVHPIVPVSLAC